MKQTKKPLFIREQNQNSSEKLRSYKKLSDPIQNNDIKKAIKYLDVSSNTKNQFRNKTHDRRKETLIYRNSKAFNTKVILNENLNEAKNSKENFSIEPKRKGKFSREDPIKSGSPILWMKNQKNRNDHCISPLIKQQSVHLLSPLSTCKNKIPEIENSSIKTETFCSNDYKTLIKGMKSEMNESLNRLQISKKFTIINKQIVESPIDEALNSIEFSESLKKNSQISSNCEVVNSKELQDDAKSEKMTETMDILFQTMKTNKDEGSKIMGRKIRFKLGEIIAEGSSSLVYKALNLDDGSLFVVKKYNTFHNNQLLETFWNEVNIYKMLDHPNVIKFFESEILEDKLFVYLEYLPGGSIKSLIDLYGALDEKIIKIYLKQILNGVSYIHSKGIVHRDIKSANILLDLNGRIKISDFGVSGQLGLNTKQDESQAFESMKGTLPFMAPEVILQQKYGNKADIWSIGCTVLEMATAKVPWGNFDNKFQAIFKIGKSEEIPFIPDSLGDKLKDFLLCCFRRNSRERVNLDHLITHPFLS